MGAFTFYKKLNTDPVILNVYKIKEQLKENNLLLSQQAYDDICGDLIAFAEDQGIKGQVWYAYILWLMVQDENTLSLKMERNTQWSNKYSLFQIALLEMQKVIELLEIDWEAINKALDRNTMDILRAYNPMEDKELSVYQERFMNLVKKYSESKSKDELFYQIADFYKEFGIGAFGRFSGFRWVDGELKPITMTDSYHLKDLVGLDLQKNQLAQNTEAFLNGKKGNNVLLYGDSGTGKSSSVKGLLNEYSSQGLRMVEVYKYQFQELPQIIATIRNRPYKWVLFFDDLSFEEYEIEYKYLKAIFEGSLEKKPDNILIYATSNRRHLVKETWKERESNDDIHINDNLQEKHSLSDRFGLAIMFLTPNQAGYLQIVEALAEKEGLCLPTDQLHRQALQWEVKHGSFSGRVATQFIHYLKQLQ